VKISVITVVRNAEKTIAEAAESVLAQDHPDFEYVVVDGASTDGTLEVLSGYAGDIDVLVSEEDDGLYNAINKGIGLASGDVVGLVHADDALVGQHVLSLIANTVEESGSEAVYGDLVYVDMQSDRVVRRWRSAEFERRRFRFGWMPPHPTLYLRRELFEKLGGYDPAFGSAADYELMLRYLYRHQIDATYIPETLVKMRVGGISNRSIRSRIEANRHDRRAWNANGVQRAWYTHYLKPLRKVGQYAHWRREIVR
jgi:glycosyltransferase involved in cell wall biosynthesis